MDILPMVKLLLLQALWQIRLEPIIHLDIKAITI